MLKWSTTVVANAASTNSVATSQTPAGAGALTLVTSTVTFGSSAAQLITVISGSNISNRTLVIVGTDVNDNAQTETVTGPNNATVTTTNAFKSVTSVTISGAAAGALTVGNSATTWSPMYVADAVENSFSIGFGTWVTASTPTWTVQHTFDDVLDKSYSYSSTSNVWFNHPIVSAWASTSGNIDGNYAFPVRGIRLILTAAGTVKMNLLQSGV